MGADTLSSSENNIYNNLCESKHKIKKMPFGVLVGTVGDVDVSDVFTAHKDGRLPCCFTLAQNDRAFVIGYDCDEVFDFLSLNGDIEASALKLSQGLEPYERFRLVKQLLEANMPDRKIRLLVMDTKTFTPCIIE